MADPLKEVSVSDSRVNPRVLFWQKELENAKKREKTFRKEADRVVKIYEGDKRQENSFNVLFSNTETLLPACYNQLPRPFVDRRFKDSDPLGKLGAQCLERTLSVLQDSGDAEYEKFTSLMEMAVLGGLVPGRGLTRFKYDAEFEEQPDAGLPEDADDTQKDAKGSVEGDDVLPLPSEKVKYETICGEDVDYDMVLFGPGREWSRIPWLAFYHEMTEADAVASFGKEIARKIKYASPGRANSDNWKKQSDDETNPQGTENVAPVWEIWNREKKEVLFYSPTYPTDLLKVEEDPYGLSGFFPCPQPLMFLLKRSKLTPTPLYTLYEEQAKELNRITTRINRILGALKVRGFYDGTMQGLKNLLDADDNTLLPATNVAALQQGQNLQNSVWFMPFDVLVNALQALWQGREEIKDTIYEITGMADIMRGEGAASAPATLQNIKNQWGTLRLKRWQRYVQEYVRECLRIMGELAGKHFSVETFAQMTDLPFATAEEQQQAQQTVEQLNQQMAMMAQQAQAMAPPPGAPAPTAPAPGGDGMLPPGAPAGGPPPPPQPSPQMQQAMQAAQATLGRPKWEDVVEFLRNDLQRYYRIDIETNSTIAADSAEDKQDITDAMAALSQMLQSFMPMVEAGALTMPAVKAMLLSVARKFSFGREVEDSITQMPDQIPPKPDPSAPSPEEKQAATTKAQADIAAAQAKMQTIQLDGQAAQAKAQQSAQEMQLKSVQMQRDEELAQQEHRLKIAEMNLRMQEIQMEMMVKQADARMDMQTSQLKTQDAIRDSQASAVVSAAGVSKAQTGAMAAKQAAKAAASKPKARPQ